MAKVGEGDPRWIVADRQDGTNVNNWHWTEKNFLPWFVENINKLYKNLPIITNDHSTISITTVEHVKGEASINTRKGKMFHLYELDIKLKWEGTYKTEKVEGSFQFPEVTFEEDDNGQDVDLYISKAANSVKNALSDELRKEGFKVIRNVLGDLLKEFKSMKGEIKEVKVASPLTGERPAGVALSEVPPSAPSTTPAPASSKPSLSTPSSTPQPSTAQPAQKVQTKTFKEDYKFRGKPDDIYNSLMDPRRVEAFTQSTAKIENKVGGIFEMYGGNISGEFVEIVPNEKIVQKWRLASWPKVKTNQLFGHYCRSSVNCHYEI
eukprot:TRINITY_DN1509_c0_g1_i2.p1 TRINITY_DN1509_c0_g1~~TRINITY_DN1509_c0_g1_i2.p1  ORF type:complete len:321 (+),score=69.16 TRINITY_DN1509_c0_g1_i2:131-1093(+)